MALIAMIPVRFPAGFPFFLLSFLFFRNSYVFFVPEICRTPEKGVD